MRSLFTKITEQANRFRATTDIPFLIFLVGVMHVSLAIKLIAIVFIYLLRPDFSFRRLTKGVPLFYPLMMTLIIIQYAFNYWRGTNYTVLAGLAFLFWGASYLISNQMKLATESKNLFRIENALKYFFILNAITSAINLLLIILEIRSVNPYTFIGMNFKYYDSTGDHIRGLTSDVSTVNMIINAFAIFYFLYKRNYPMSVICYLVAACTTSNLGNVILFFFFVCVLVFDRSKFNKSVMLCYISFLIVFIVKISPSNLNYLNNKSKDLLHLKKTVIEKHYEDYSEKDKLVNNYINVQNEKSSGAINSDAESKVRTLLAEKERLEKENLLKEDTVYMQKDLIKRNRFVETYNEYFGDTLTTLNQAYYDKYPGKYLSFKETFAFVGQNAKHFLIGAGAGNFSSKLAFKASNIDISGKYVKRFTYVAPEFKEGHFKITLRFLMKPISEHSIINFPNSVLNQLLGEYGVIGLLLFLVFYVWYFLRRYRRLTYGKILLPMCLAFMLTDYWFESLSVVLIFELMMFLNISETSTDIKEA
jgi:hypothetical protein